MYREIDTLQKKITFLTVEVERRHAIIALKNAEIEHRNAHKAEGEEKERLITRNTLYDGAIQEHAAQLGKEARPVLLKILETAEAGKPLPDFIRDFLESLNTVPGILAYNGNTAKIWAAQVEELSARLSPYFNTQEPKPTKRMREYLTTSKSQAEIKRIFHDLAAAGYIAGSTPEALPDFLNAFNQEPTAPQGNITWKWTAKNGSISPAQILDFVVLMAGGYYIFDFDNTAIYPAVSAIFGVEVSADIKRRFRSGDGSSIYNDLERIIKP